MNSPNTIFVLRLRGNGDTDIHELRRLLKILLRRFGLSCIGITQEQVPE